MSISRLWICGRYYIATGIWNLSLLFFFFFFLFNDVSHFLTLLIFSRQEEKFKRINTETQRNVKVYF